MALKVKFLRSHIDWKPGDTARVDDTQARYMVRMGLVELDEPEPEAEVEQQLMQHLEAVKPVENNAPEKPKPIKPAKTTKPVNNVKKKK